MRASGEWLAQKATQKLFDVFEGAGHQLFCVGGCVRNALLGEPVADIDMSTDARPDQVLALAQRLKLRSVPTGIDHGTVTILMDGHPFEITTYRKDVETDGRRAVVAFADSIEQDAQRRDLTINALYCDARGEVADPVGGLDDIAARRVRFIGEASERIREDYLRILRFFRFYAWYGAVEGGIDEDGLAACADLAEGLESLSAERIGAEMRKLLSAPDPGPAVASMSQSGVLHRIMPGAEASTLPILIHFENAIAPDWTRRALMIGGEDIAERWRLTKMEARNIALMRSALEQDTSVLELAYRHDVELARNVALVRSASLQQPTTVDLEKQLSEASKASFPVKSADLMPAFEGAALGKELKRLEARWIASNFTMSKSELLAQ